MIYKPTANPDGKPPKLTERDVCIKYLSEQYDLDPREIDSLMTYLEDAKQYIDGPAFGAVVRATVSTLESSLRAILDMVQSYCW